MPSAEAGKMREYTASDLPRKKKMPIISTTINKKEMHMFNFRCKAVVIMLALAAGAFALDYYPATDRYVKSDYKCEDRKSVV
jgi:hypothetical protein